MPVASIIKAKQKQLKLTGTMLTGSLSIATPALTKQHKQLTSGTLWYMEPAISPDGRSVAFTMGTETRCDVYRMSVDGGQPTQLTSVGDALTWSPAWSPDGAQIAFISDQGGTPKVWIVNAEGGSPRVLEKTNDSDTNHRLAWSPSSELVYSGSNLHNLRRLDAETQKETPILPQDSGGWLTSKAQFSPDGKQIAISWNVDPDPGAWLFNLNDLSTSRLSTTMLPIGWSPDGKSVYGFHGGGVKILEVKVADSGNPRLVDTLPGSIQSGTVSPDGRRIIVSVSDDHSDIWLMKNFDPEAAQVQ
jgi:Tol biopolymer transport system component